MGDLSYHNNATKLGKVIGSKNKVDLRALVETVRNSGNIQTDRTSPLEEDIEKACPFLRWCTPEVSRKTLENTTHLNNMENRLPMH